MGTGFVKNWTAMKRNKDYRAMNCLGRGAWHQLLLECKDQDDNGYVRANSMPNLASTFKINRATLLNLCQKWHEAKLIELQISPSGVDILIHNYDKWQQATVDDVRTHLSNSSQKWQEPKKEIPLPDQTRAEQTKPEQTPQAEKFNPHKEYLEYLGTEKKRIMDFLSMLDFRVLGKPEFIWDKILIDGIAKWIRENPERACDKLAHKHAGNWMNWIEQKVWWERGEEMTRINKTRGLTMKQEADHFRQKELNRGAGGDAVSLGDVLKKAKENL